MAKSNHLVSVAMCTFNGERFIKEQLDSILNQTYSNIELIICDDGSSDKTIDIVKQYIENDSRIKLYQNKVNLGFVKNFEKAISLSTGEYIALADQDDIWKLDKLEIFVNEIKNSILIYSDATLIDANSKRLNSRLIYPDSNLVYGDCAKSLLLSNCISGNTLMFKKELLSYILPIPCSVKFHDAWIAFIASSVSTIALHNSPLTLYRRYSDQITHTKKKYFRSPIEKLSYKKDRLLNDIKEKQQYYADLLKLTFLDEDIKHLILSIKNHYDKFHIGCFNTKLYGVVSKSKDDIFAIKKSNKRSRYARALCYKLNLHRLVLFSS